MDKGTGVPMKRRIAAILAADVASYTRLVAEDEEATIARLAEYREVFDDFVARAGGRIFNTAGDSVMCAFESAVEAVRCAIDIQEALRTRNALLPPERRLQFRIGISIGDVVERNGDLLGDGVNLAARLEGIAEPGGITVSRFVFEAVAGKVSVPFRDLGRQELKNVPQPVHAFSVDLGAERMLGGHPRPPGRRRLSAAALALGLASLVLGLAVLWMLSLRPPAPVPAPMAGTGDPPAGPAAGPARAPLPADPAQAFAQLARSGGIVPDARTAPELYHNARLHEARGDGLAARQAYAALVALGGERVDPYLRYAALLRVQDGRAGARETFTALREAGASRVAALVHALQGEGDERRRRVEAFLIEHPDYAPALFLLAEEFSEDRLGPQTLHERRAEREAYERFLAAEERLPPFFLDSTLLGAWLDRARTRRAALDAAERASPAPALSFSRSNSGWIVSVALPEAATALRYRIGSEGPFRSTGLAATPDPRTGKPAPVPYFELPTDQERTVIEVAYADARGRDAAPTAIRFDPRAALSASQREILERMPGAWLAVRGGREALLYWTHLVSYRCALTRVEIGLDGADPTRALPLPPCDMRDPHAIPHEARPYLPLPAGTRAVSARLTFADGTASEVRTFKVP
ncbi:MAG TPA: adenylate/guanylate cyclase domain-containing protein [Salinarimonas sp.]|nr:adenylate/guanylate cyclase domain-containing protein [Salinarimonas sp.]